MKRQHINHEIIYMQGVVLKVTDLVDIFSASYTVQMLGQEAKRFKVVFGQVVQQLLQLQHLLLRILQPVSGYHWLVKFCSETNTQLTSFWSNYLFTAVIQLQSSF